MYFLLSPLRDDIDFHCKESLYRKPMQAFFLEVIQSDRMHEYGINGRFNLL